MQLKAPNKIVQNIANQIRDFFLKVKLKVENEMQTVKIVKCIFSSD